MPKNRRNISQLSRHTVHVSTDALNATREWAKAHDVTVGSVIDTSLRYLMTLPDDEILVLMQRYEHLTDTEAAEIKKNRKEPQ